MHSSSRPWRKTKKRREKRKQKEENPEPKKPRVRAGVPDGRGWFFLWFLTEGKGEQGLPGCRVRPRGPPGCGPWGRRGAVGIPGAELGGSGAAPTTQQNKSQRKDCFSGLCSLLFVLVFPLSLTDTSPRVPGDAGASAEPPLRSAHPNRRTERKPGPFLGSFRFVFSATFVAAGLQPRATVARAGDCSSASRFGPRELLAAPRAGGGTATGCWSGGKHFPKEKRSCKSPAAREQQPQRKADQLLTTVRFCPSSAAAPAEGGPPPPPAAHRRDVTFSVGQQFIWLGGAAGPPAPGSSNGSANTPFHLKCICAVLFCPLSHNFPLFTHP